MDHLSIQEWRGVRGLVAAEIITDTAEEWKTGEPFQVAGIAELTRTTEANSEPHYYDNIPAVVIESVGSDEVTVSASAISFDVTAEITGQEYDASKGMFVEGERQSKYFAMGYITEKTDGTEVFVWRAKGKFNIPDTSHSTKTDGAEANGQELIYTGINTTHKFSVNGKQKTFKAVNVDTSVNPVDETSFFSSVQTPETVKAATSTASTTTK